jgi:hypothetical protein
MTGPGIIVNDGSMWEHARAMIRPAFTRTLIANRDTIDVHVERFFDFVPTNGSVIDLQPLFDRLVWSNLRRKEATADPSQILDSSSEFIFGESFGSLLPTCPIDSQIFLDSFNYAQKGVGIRVLLSKARFLMRDAKFFQSCKLIQDYTRKHVDRALQRKDGR